MNKTRVYLLVLIIFFSALFLHLLSSRMLFEKSDGWYSGGSTWGDLALHLSLISYFASSHWQPLEWPIFAGERLSYPFVFDFLSAVLLKLGFSYQLVLILPAFFLTLLFILIFYFLALRITKKPLAAFLAPILFFFNGGLGFIWFIKDGLPWQTMTKQYSHLAELNIRFSNIISDYFLPQRTVIPGLFLGTAVIFLFYQFQLQKKRKFLFSAGIITGLLPFVHVHSFISLIILAIFFLILNQNRKSWFWFFLPAVMISFWQIFWFLPSVIKSEHFFKLQFGWMKDEDNFFWFWLKNLGLFPLILTVSFIKSSAKIKRFYLPFLALFIISNIFIFQPHDYDNMKIMLYWFLLSAILVADYLVRIKKLVAVLLIFLLIFTGMLSVYWESYASYQMFNNEDIILADFVKKNTESKAIFLTSDKHNHPVSTLTGRQILMGYRGWLWTYGIDYRQREKDVLAMFAGGQKAIGLLQKYQVDYIVVGPSELENFSANEDFFRQNFPLFYQSENYKIYKINH